jgi:ribose transport system substrate-binding protein
MRVQRFMAAVAVGATAVLAACSSQADSPSAAGASGGSASLSALQSVIDQYEAMPTFTPPGPAVDPAKVRGKSVFNIPDSSGNPFATGVAQAEAQAAKELGVRYINCTNQGQVTEWVTCYDEAIQRKVNVINDFGGVDPRELGPQILQAQAAGIQVAAENVYGFSQTPVGVKYSIPTPYETAGRLMADWVVLDTKRKADALVLTSNEVLATSPIVSGIKSVFAEQCPGCKLTFVNVPVKDWSTQIQSNVQSALVRDPNLNYIIPIYDSMTQFVVPAITAAGKVGRVFVSTFNGTPFVLKYIQDGDIVRMDLGEDLQWVGYAFVDADARLLDGQGLPQIFNAKTPLRVFTKNNIAQAGSPPQLSTGYGSSYLAGYQKLWGLSS